MTQTAFLDPKDWLKPEKGPRYVQLRQRIEEGIERGIFLPKSPLPSERDLASLTGLSRVTVRNAIQDLVKSEHIIQVQGSGSFVTEKAAKFQQTLKELTSFSQDMATRGKTVTSQWLERGIFRATPEEIETLGLDEGASVARVARLRCADGVPLAIERASLPLNILPNPMDVTESLYALLDVSGHRPVRAVQKITAVNVEPHDAKLLDVRVGAAGLRIVRFSYLADGAPAELTHSLYRGDAYDFIAELNI